MLIRSLTKKHQSSHTDAAAFCNENIWNDLLQQQNLASDYKFITPPLNVMHILWKLGMSSYPLLGDAVVGECVKQQSAMQAM